MRWAIWWHMPACNSSAQEAGQVALWEFWPAWFALWVPGQPAPQSKTLSLKERSGEWLKIPGSDFWLLHTYSHVTPPNRYRQHVFTHKVNEKPRPLLMFTARLCTLPVTFMCIRLSSLKYAGARGHLFAVASLPHLYIVLTSLLLGLQT